MPLLQTVSVFNGNHKDYILGASDFLRSFWIPHQYMIEDDIEDELFAHGESSDMKIRLKLTDASCNQLHVMPPNFWMFLFICYL